MREELTIRPLGTFGTNPMTSVNKANEILRIIICQPNFKWHSTGGRGGEENGDMFYWCRKFSCVVFISSIWRLPPRLIFSIYGFFDYVIMC